MPLDLAQLIKRFQPQSALALSLEPERLTVSLVRLENKECRTTSVCFLPIGAEAILKNPARAGAELIAALNAAGVRERRCVLNVPQSWALTASADLPEVSSEDLRGYFELRAEREFSSSASDLKLAYCPYSLPDGKKRATLAAIPIKRMEAIEEMLNAAGCRTLSISLGMDSFLSETRPLLHFAAEDGQTDLVVSTGNGIAALRTLSGSSSSGEAALDTTVFLREIRITMGRIPESIRQDLQHARFHGTLAKALRGQIHDDLKRLGIESETVDATSKSVGTAALSADLYLRNQPVAFEYVVAEPNRWLATFERLNTLRGRQIALAAIAIILLPLLIFLVRAHRESSLNAEWDGMKNSVAELEAIQQKTRQFRPWFEPTPQSLQILQTLIAAFPEKGEVWTKSVQIKGASDGTNKVVCSGFARNQPALMAMMDRLLKTPGVTALSQRTLGNNPVQFTATYLWKPRNDQ